LSKISNGKIKTHSKPRATQEIENSIMVMKLAS